MLVLALWSLWSGEALHAIHGQEGFHHEHWKRSFDKMLSHIIFLPPGLRDETSKMMRGLLYSCTFHINVAAHHPLILTGNLIENHKKECASISGIFSSVANIIWHLFYRMNFNITTLNTPFERKAPSVSPGLGRVSRKRKRGVCATWTFLVSQDIIEVM